MSQSEDSTQIQQSLQALAPAVYIIGAGPGDPDLLTIKAVKILQKADVIVFADSLVPRQVLQGIRPDAELVRTGNKTLEEILPLMIERVRSHKSVVRLHSGDVSLYSAIHEQMQALTEAQIPFEVIPGISAYQAAAAKLAVELTVPELVQTIILTRISGRASAVPESEELASLAAHQASLCLYLSARHIEEAQTKLLTHYPVDTPVAVCFRIGWSDEKIWVVPLEKMAALTEQENLVRTTLYLISPALREGFHLPEKFSSVNSGVSDASRQEIARSRLYHPEHSHLFRPSRSENGE
ncbi:precorrin-4 C(11)-methyltransferase [Coleofasciculus sp. LEGE 07092]|uniref:precorrin-4 C(11)-methyltransferase n=1 Tax=Coleofasciculus sp. LEGE 07092 TaxID=2777969 RepID=UPI001881E8B1|nr:precorrin-4 C(11)-methyltransferase [Coleofasciculus sp. LEGE 07092]MBE9149681.1 precorrin-4 C(11)-methyltransferase [Coleofasciculus sp. LEGE 07092]